MPKLDPPMTRDGQDDGAVDAWMVIHGVWAMLTTPEANEDNRRYAAELRSILDMLEASHPTILRNPWIYDTGAEEHETALLHNLSRGSSDVQVNAWRRRRLARPPMQIYPEA